MTQQSDTASHPPAKPAARGGYDAYFDNRTDSPAATTDSQLRISGGAMMDTTEPDPSAASPATTSVAGDLDLSRPHLPAVPAGLAPRMVTAELLSGVAGRQIGLRSQHGVRGALNNLGFRLGLSAAEQRIEDRRERIRRRLSTTYRIAVISVKGGVGRTTTTAAVGSTFAALRPDRVVAVDASPHFGDLATRTRRHPYGLSLRDLARADDSAATFSHVQSYLSINAADLAIVAAPWSTEGKTALSGEEYLKVSNILRRHFSLALIDCHTGFLEEATSTVLNYSDAAVVVTPATVSGVTGAAATLNWLGAHGLDHLVSRSVIAVVHQHPGKPAVASEPIRELFDAVARPTCFLPYDPHLAEGGEVDLRRLRTQTCTALEELAALLADDFPGYLVGDHHRTTADQGIR